MSEIDDLRAQLATAVAAREEAERDAAALKRQLAAAMTQAEERGAAYDIAESLRIVAEAACHRMEREVSAAEARAERLAEALAPFADPERYNTTEEECRENKAMRWCAVHSFRWPCPVGPARAALAEEPK